VCWAGVFEIRLTRSEAAVENGPQLASGGWPKNDGWQKANGPKPTAINGLSGGAWMSGSALSLNHKRIQ
jgi:hypothetical protein